MGFNVKARLKNGWKRGAGRDAADSSAGQHTRSTTTHAARDPELAPLYRAAAAILGTDADVLETEAIHEAERTTSLEHPPHGAFTSKSHWNHGAGPGSKSHWNYGAGLGSKSHWNHGSGPARLEPWQYGLWFGLNPSAGA